MRVIITCDPKIDYPEEIVFKKFKEWCEISFQSGFKIEIEGTKYKFEKNESKTD